MKTSPFPVIAGVGLLGAAALAFALFAPRPAAQTTAVADLARFTHVHGLAVDRADPTRVLIATHHGLYRAGPDGRAELVSEVQDFMGFNPHPTDPALLYASGHPATGGNLGFVRSTDAGRTWTRVAPGLFGPVDFHQMTVSPANPEVIYGAFLGLQVSRNGGVRWELAGPLPDQLIDLAASAESADTLYAATGGGLLVSTDGGRSWSAALSGAPISAVETAPDGRVYAFVPGQGLLVSPEPVTEFAVVTDLPGETLIHLAFDPADGARLFAATTNGAVVASGDGGRTWSPFGAGPAP